MNSIEVVRFYGDELQAVREGNRVWVVVKRVCDALGIDEAGQRRTLCKKDWATTDLKSSVAEDGKIRMLFCLELDSLPMWLANIDPSRVKPEVRVRLAEYQRECARVLRDHFFRRPRPSDIEPLFAQLPEELAAILAPLLIDGLRTVLLPRVTALEQRVGWIERVLPTAVQGQISAHGLSCLRSSVRRIAELEVLLGRWRSMSAARAGVYRALSEHVGWGGAAKCWEFLPLHLEQFALAFLRERLRTAQRLLGEHPQLALAGTEDDDEGDDGSGKPH